MYIINNYQLGSRMRMTPVDKIVEKQRVDKSHTQIIYEINDREKQFIDKCYAQNMEGVNLQKGDKMAVTKRYLRIEPGQKVFVVFASKREGYKENIVLRCNVRECSIRKNTTVYYLTKEKVVLGKRDIKPFIDCFSCENANIDTGYRGMQTDIYPVFTTKEKCIEWLKG